jgi:hypothetical protein
VAIVTTYVTNGYPVGTLGLPTTLKDRKRRLELAEDVAIVVERSSTHPIEYAIVLVVRRDGDWHAARTFDNAHDVEEHHEHSYIADTKQPPIVTNGSVNEAMSRALVQLHERWADIVAEWDQTR